LSFFGVTSGVTNAALCYYYLLISLGLFT